MTPSKNDKAIGLRCKFCGGEVKITGRWANAKVSCKDCGMELAASEYDQEIERMKEELIKSCFEAKRK